MSMATSRAWIRARSVWQIQETLVVSNDLFHKPFPQAFDDLNEEFDRFGLPKSYEISAFQWNHEMCEDSQVEQQVKYLEDVLQLRMFNTLLSGAYGKYSWENLPIVTIPLYSGGVGIEGIADILVEFEIDCSILVFEIKKPSNPLKRAPFNPNQSNSQALGYAERSPYPILHVTTDLQNVWQLRYLKQSKPHLTLCTLEVMRDNAITLIRYFFLAAVHALKVSNQKNDELKGIFNAGFIHGGDGGNEDGEDGGNYKKGDWFGRVFGDKLKLNNFRSGPAAGGGTQDAMSLSGSEQRKQLKELREDVEAQVEEDFRCAETDEWSEEQKARQKKEMARWLFAEIVAKIFEARRQGMTYDEFMDKHEQESDDESLRDPVQAMLHKAEGIENFKVIQDLHLYRQQPSNVRVRQCLESQTYT